MSCLSQLNAFKPGVVSGVSWNKIIQHAQHAQRNEARMMVSQARVNPQQQTALGNAAMHGDINDLQLLLSIPFVRSQINFTDRFGMTALHHASYSRSTSCIDALVNAGAICTANVGANGVENWPVDYVTHFCRRPIIEMEPDEFEAFKCLRSYGCV